MPIVMVANGFVNFAFNGFHVLIWSFCIVDYLIRIFIANVLLNVRDYYYMVRLKFKGLVS